MNSEESEFLVVNVTISEITFYIYIYIYRYHTMTDIYTAALLPTKPSSDDDFRFKHGVRTGASLPHPSSNSQYH